MNLKWMDRCEFTALQI